MDRFGTLKLFMAVSLLGGVCRCWKAYVQKPVRAVKGSCVLVPCSTVPYRDIKWYKYQKLGYPVVYSSDRSEIMGEFRGRTSVPGSAQEGNCTLRIDNVRIQDREVDLYVWIWKPDGDHKGFYDQTIQINVLERRQALMSVEDPQVEGKAFSATCKFWDSCPSSPPNVTWQGLHPISNVLTHTKDSEGLWVTEANATFRVTHRDQNKSLSCASTLSGQSFTSTSVLINVTYPPSILPGSFCSTLNGTLQCVCQAEGKPNAVIFWTIDGSGALFPPFNTTTQHNGSLTVSEVTGPLGYNVTCTATNSVGTEVTQIPINLEGNASSALVAGLAGGAGVCAILGLAVIWKKRRHAEPVGDLSTVQQVSSDKIRNDYSLHADEDLYVNTVPGQQAHLNQDTESCLYQNYDERC